MELIFWIIIIVIGCKILPPLYYELVYNIKQAIKRQARKIEEERYIAEEKRIKEKWINDLNNGKPVTMGEAVIQFKNDNFIIDGHSFLIKEIQKLDITCEILYVLEETIKTYNNSGYNNVCSPIYLEEYGTLYSSLPNEDFGKVIDTQRLTMEEYNAKLKRMFERNEYGDEYYFKSHRIEYEKEYHLIITYDGTQNYCPLGRETDKSKNCEIPIEAEERFTEINRCFKRLKGIL
ncbi:MAG: hypothetical protein ACI4U9_03500 [Clostridia bacterium]